jgi:hypothetical protein
MAGSWIKLRHDVLDAPEIRRAARATGLDCDQVLGKCARLWSWADRHGVDGLVKFAQLEDVDEQVGHVGFGSTLVSVGWLAANDLGVVIPNWERHFSDSAKARALGANRAEKHRNGTSVTHPPDPVTQEALPEKTREEKILPPLPREGFDRDTWQRLRRQWNAGPGKPWKMLNPPPPAVDRMCEPDWLHAFEAGIDKLRKVRFFKTAVSLRQFCSVEERKGRFLDRLLGGEFDDQTATKERGDFGGTPAPPKTWDGPAEDARRAMLERSKKLKEVTT